MDTSTTMVLNNSAVSGEKLQTTGIPTRTLTMEETEKLEKDTCLVTEFKQLKLEKEAQKNWDLFYKRNTTRFFKDRHWTKREFEELCETQNSGGKLTLFEAGCGVGNFIFPLLEEDTEKMLYIYACDFSQRAVNFVKENKLYDPERCHCFQSDLTKDDITTNIPDNTVDIATLIFVLSAIHPDKMVKALENIITVLKPGGYLLFRDYGLYDHAMLRFAPGHKLSEQFYVRQDGTRAYYFSIETLDAIFRSAGFEVSSIEYVHRETVNHKERLCVPRIFVQAKCKKPMFNIENPVTCLETPLRTTHSDDSQCTTTERQCEKPAVTSLKSLCENAAKVLKRKNDRVGNNDINRMDSGICSLKKLCEVASKRKKTEIFMNPEKS